jgi:CRP-like cAMP-binding protein
MAAEISEKLEKHFSQYPHRSYPKGQILIHGGDAPQHIFYIVKGNVRQYDISYRGDEIIVNVFKPQNFFPMLWAITRKPNKYFFEADTDVEVRLAPVDETVNFLKDNPDILFDLLSRVYKGLDGVLGRMVHLMSGSAKSRVLYELAVECRRFGKIAENGSCLISISEGDLAGRAGLSRETVSREINKLSQEGLVNVSHSGILISDLKSLESKLSP